jgi:phenylacetate-CoA ligase
MISAQLAYRSLPGFLKPPAKLLYSLVPFPWQMGLQFGRYFEFFMCSQYYPAEQLRSLQWSQLQRTLQTAHTSVSAYQALFDKEQIHLSDIKSFEDFEKIPMTTKEDLRRGSFRYLNSDLPKSKIIARKTSGSTGTPKTVYSTEKTHIVERALMFRGWTWAGFEPGDRFANLTYGLEQRTNREGPPFLWYRNRLEISPQHTQASDIDFYLDVLKRFDPQHVRVYPSLAILYGKRMQERGISFPNLKSIWSQSETFLPGQRERIEKIWGHPVRDLYGLQEKCASMSECEHGSLHVHSEFGYVELVPVPGSMFSEIVATGFYNDAMPLLRYNTGDLAVADARPCPCGRALPVIQRLEGRMDDFLVSTEGKLVRFMSREIVRVRHLKECQFIQEAKDWVRFRYVADTGFNRKDELTVRSIVVDLLGPTMKLTMEKVNDLYRTHSGKAPFIVSRLGPG